MVRFLYWLRAIDTESRLCVNYFYQKRHIQGLILNVGFKDSEEVIRIIEWRNQHLKYTIKSLHKKWPALNLSPPLCDCNNNGTRFRKCEFYFRFTASPTCEEAPQATKRPKWKIVLSKPQEWTALQTDGLSPPTHGLLFNCVTRSERCLLGICCDMYNDHS